MSDEKLSKREIILNTIEEGGATMETLMETADCKYASVMSAFSMLRLMGHYPIKDVPIEDEEGNEVLTYRVVTAEEAEKIKAEKAANSTAKAKPTKTPQERFEMTEKRVARCEKAAEAAAKRANKDLDNEELSLRSQKADIELKLAKIEFDKASANYTPADEPVDEALEESGATAEEDFEA